MELNEFSNEFDVLYNSITSNQAPGLDEYEKSVFLTKAQNEILISYFDPRSNKVQEGYDDSQRRQIDFSKITKLYTFTPVQIKSNSSSQLTPGDTLEVSSLNFGTALFDPRSNSKSVTIPSKILMVLNERVTVTRDGRTGVPLTVVPVQFNEYDRLMSKPFKRPLKNQAWRVFNYNSSTVADLVAGPGDVITSYQIRYVERPTPIILTQLEDDLSIDGYTAAMGCKLDPILHHEILQRAVELAKAAWSGDLQSQIALGQASQTDIGQIQSR